MPTELYYQEKEKYLSQFFFVVRLERKGGRKEKRRDQVDQILRGGWLKEWGRLYWEKGLIG